MAFLLPLFLSLCLAQTIQWNKITNTTNELWYPKRLNAASTTVIKNGEVAIFIFGGRDKDKINCCTDSYFYYPNRSSNRFEIAASNPYVNSTGISLHRMVTIGNYVYSYGGNTVEQVEGLPILYRYDINKDKWEIYDQNGPSFVSHSLTASLDGKTLYIFGGAYSSDAMEVPSNRLYTFDIASKKWTMYSSGWGKLWPTARSSHLAIMYRGYTGEEMLAIIGGEGASMKCPDDMYWSYNTRTGMWSYLPFPDGIYCFVDGGALPFTFNSTSSLGTFVFFGGDSADARNWNENAYVYNDATASWKVYKTDKSKENPIGFRMFAYGLTSLEPRNNEFIAHTIGGCFAPDQLPFCNTNNYVWEMKLSL